MAHVLGAYDEGGGALGISRARMGATSRIRVILLCAITALSTAACTAPPAPPSAPAQTATSVPTPTVPPPPPVTAIVNDLTDVTVGTIGVRTRATLSVGAIGTKLTYVWQHRPPKGGAWKTIAGAKSASYTARASAWASGTQFRVLVTGKEGKVTSATATLTVQKPSQTPAKDAEKLFGLQGLRQGVDISAYQYTPTKKVDLKAIRKWTGKQGFAILRNGSGDRPIDYAYTNPCTNKPAKTKTSPVVRDCAYADLAAGAAKNGLSLGHYWFNGWVSSVDTTTDQLFAGGYTPTASAKLFVKWLTTYGHYTKASTDPLVLDVEDGTTRTKTVDGTKYRVKLRHWTPGEALEFLTVAGDELTRDGYHANLYVYMPAKTALELDEYGSFAWAEIAGIARLWVAAWGIDSAGVPEVQPQVGPWAAFGGWSIWQYTSRAPIANANATLIDGNIAKADAWTPR